MTALAAVAYPNGTPQPYIEVTGTGFPAGTDSVTLYRTAAGIREIVRGVNRRPATGALVIQDFEAPFATPVTYEIQTFSAAGAQTSTATSTAVTLTGGAQCAWLSAPGIPTLAMPIVVVDDGQPNRSVDRSVLYPIGRSRPIVTTGQRHGREQGWTFGTSTLNQRDQFLAIVNAANPVLLRTMPRGVPGGFIALGDVEESRLINSAASEIRTFAATGIEVDAPTQGYGLSAHNWQELKDTWPTWQTVKDSYTSWLAVARDPTKAS
jgi:hypothetical protein